MNKPWITILMATYNGEQFIEQQLDSLLAQSVGNWNLLIRDDGSNDNTVSIIQGYIAKYNNISLIINDTTDKGACTNFSALFSQAVADEKIKYVMFCDQDDIWKPQKLENSLQEIQLIENQYPNKPALVYTNFELMDNCGKFVEGTFKLKHSIQLKNLLSFNFVYGCTILMNRAMMDRIQHIPKCAINHDYWVALVASIYQSKFINQPLLQYRQHNNNVSGNVAGNNNLVERLKRNLLLPDKEIDKLAKRLNMFTEFYKEHGQHLQKSENKIMREYLSAFRKNRFHVCFVMLKGGIFRKGFLQTIGAFVQVLFFYKKLQAKRSF